MTDGNDKPWFGARMLPEKKRSWSVLADCSMPVLQPQETIGRRQLPDKLTAPACHAPVHMAPKCVDLCATWAGSDEAAKIIKNMLSDKIIKHKVINLLFIRNITVNNTIAVT